ncbi:PREDICTED: cytochrome c oxidase subunit 4 isoform 1, mitochondrial-like [Ceratotherium simum simum]|uniref:Cytochrome c oxidase subunit 4 isoform 1, mitochondrial n=1 Tax=Ceratotherium simum simum TaxID=73337 RepID=A0ABM0H7G2_CERSS|nr:PREDICTED: cytochrome c oxidase subunit 4 isoform 1, mitochondrial-like [Ceratotherium simum simum]
MGPAGAVLFNRMVRVRLLEKAASGEAGEQLGISFWTQEIEQRIKQEGYLQDSTLVDVRQKQHSLKEPENCDFCCILAVQPEEEGPHCVGDSVYSTLHITVEEKARAAKKRPESGQEGENQRAVAAAGCRLQSFSLAGKRATSTSVCARAHGSVVKSEDCALPNCVDRRDYPLPDVAHVKNLSASQKALKETEKAPWSSLSTDEQVELRRSKSSESFAEMSRSTNEWKTVAGAATFFIGFAALLLIWEKHCVHGPVPHSSEGAWAAKQTTRMLHMTVSPIQGFSAKWDYDRNKWKK